MTSSERIAGELSPYASAWALDASVIMLNHGSFGGCPRAVLEAQERFRRLMERRPMDFFIHELEPLLDESRGVLSELLGVDAADLVFVRNVTEAINAVLRSLRLEPGDELLVTDHAYNACRNAVDFVAGRAGARLVVAPVPLPIHSVGEVVDAVTRHVTGRTRLAVLDHITSPTAVIFPIEALVRELERRGVDTLVDGAHAPGMVRLDLNRLGAAYYAGNCHKWLCAPKGAGFLHVRRDRQADLHPTVISHGYNTRRPGRSRLHDEFDWPGTDDPTAWLCAGEAIGFLGKLMAGGIGAVMEHNHRLAIDGQRILMERLEVVPVCSDEMLGSMAAVCLPDDADDTAHRLHPLQNRLREEFGIEVLISQWPAPPRRVLRISAQAYNHPAQYGQLAGVLRGLVGTA